MSAKGKVARTPNEQLEAPKGLSRVLIPGSPSLPLHDNNKLVLEMIARAMGGEAKFNSDKY